MNGQMADLRVWGTARTDAEIADNMTANLTGNQGGALLGHWTFEEGSGTTALDTAGSVNGAITGAKYVDVAPAVLGTAATTAEGDAISGLMTTDGLVGTATYATTGAAPSNGSVAINSTTGEWTYTPNAKFHGSDSFTLRATGATSGTDDETVTVTVRSNDLNSNELGGSFMAFDGVNDYVDLGTVNISGAYTLEAWVNPSVYNLTSNGYGRIFDLGESGSANDNINLMFEACLSA